jgi:hypothetical protein
MQPLPHHGFHTPSGLQPLLGPGCQQSLTQTVYSPNGYQQPAVWRDGSLGYRTSIPLANGYTPQNSVDGAFMPSQATIHHGLPNAQGLGQAQHFGLPLPGRPVDDGFPRHGRSLSAHHAACGGPLNPAAGYVAKVSVAGDINSPARFKERALQNAHKTYNDLLLYLTSTKKSAHGRSGSISRPSSKMVVYPKPSTTPAGPGSKARLVTIPADPFTNYSQQLAQKDGAARAFINGQMMGENPAVAAEILGGQGQHRNPYQTAHHQRLYHDIGSPSPVSNAKAALEILSTLCEQSGWKWVEGILLGGCLHYGLEHYEKALEWFKRIVNLDAR